MPHLVLLHLGSALRVIPVSNFEIGAPEPGAIPFQPVRFTIPMTGDAPEPGPGYVIHDPDAHTVVAQVVISRVFAFTINPHDLYVEGWTPAGP